MGDVLTNEIAVGLQVVDATKQLRASLKEEHRLVRTTSLYIEQIYWRFA